MPELGLDIQKDFIGCLPELPPVMAEFFSLAREKSLSKRSYANYLLSDPTLSTRIFSYINLVLNPSSLGYISINKGISLMGLHKFKNVVLVFSLYPAFEEAGCVELFKHSLACAFISKFIASQFNFINPDDAFLLGFLHDIGKIALKIKFNDRYQISIKDDVRSREYSLEEEVNEFKYCHADLSEYITRSWNLPVVINDAIKYHHFPIDAMVPQAASIIYLSNIVQKNDYKQQQQMQKVLHYMQLTKTDISQFTGHTTKQILPFYEILSIQTEHTR